MSIFTWYLYSSSQQKAHFGYFMWRFVFQLNVVREKATIVGMHCSKSLAEVKLFHQTFSIVAIEEVYQQWKQFVKSHVRTAVPTMITVRIQVREKCRFDGGTWCLMMYLHIFDHNCCRGMLSIQREFLWPSALQIFPRAVEYHTWYSVRMRQQYSSSAEIKLYKCLSDRR